jgi:hypothetical protein
MTGSTQNRTLQLIFFPECPGYELVKEKLQALHLTDVEEINCLTLPIGHPYQGFSSPSLIWNDQVLLGSKVADKNVLSCSYFLEAEIDRALEIYLK